MKQILPLLFIGFLLIFSFVGANAVEYFQYVGISFDKTPDVCLLDTPEAKGHFNLTQQGINAWSDGLNKMTKTKDWNMTLRTVDRMEMTHCDIVFIYDIANHDIQKFAGTSGREVGVWSCVGIELTFCEIHIHALYDTNNTLTTIEHEFGHALGLGHRIASDGDKFGWVSAFLSDDILFPWQKTHAHITPEDLKAIIHIYGPYGFHLVNSIPESYTILTPVTIKVYCNGVNATGGICDQVITPDYMNNITLGKIAPPPQIN